MSFDRKGNELSEQLCERQERLSWQYPNIPTGKGQLLTGQEAAVLMQEYSGADLPRGGQADPSDSLTKS